MATKAKYTDRAMTPAEIRRDLVARIDAYQAQKDEAEKAGAVFRAAAIVPLLGTAQRDLERHDTANGRPR